ncbi:MAG: metal ABC transporter substrate-binding protein [Acidaminococcaceae bacterium]|nr:metal ABC transporter substrate-binding protein [Acidaminococcaceae bacterium]MDD4721385.1 metal ABC transporter substrate-binding protein [Acidaminococcaceae bacterium]
MKRLFLVLVAIFMSVGFLAGCGNKVATDKDKLQVVTTVFATYDFARQVGGDKVQATMLVPPGAEIHAYEPTPQDIKKIKESQVFVYVGGESDEWVKKILASVDSKHLKVIRLLDTIKPVEEVIKPGMTEEKKTIGASDEKEYDEHVWTSPANAIKISAKLKDVFSTVDSGNKAIYEKNYLAYTAKLNTLDKEFKDIVAHSKRKVVVFGDRFPLRYFMDAYGLDYFAAFPGCARDTEPSASTVAFLIDKVRQEKIPVVFHIELSNEKIAKAIASATGAKVLQFNTCHNVPRDEFKKGVTYVSLMQENAKALKEALQ